MKKTLKVRVKDKHAKELRLLASRVNYVWNFANDLAYKKLVREGEWMSGFDFHPYTTGSSNLIGLYSNTIQEVCEEYSRKRNAAKKQKLSWRKSSGSRRSLGWIPFKTGYIKFKAGKVVAFKKGFDVWDSYGLENYEFRSSCFVEDARGRWYFCVCVDVEQIESKSTGSVGIDLGCKETATDSQGNVIAGREYRNLEPNLKSAQRANHLASRLYIMRKKQYTDNEIYLLQQIEEYKKKIFWSFLNGACLSGFLVYFWII